MNTNKNKAVVYDSLAFHFFLFLSNDIISPASCNKANKSWRRNKSKRYELFMGFDFLNVLKFNNQIIK